MVLSLLLERSTERERGREGGKRVTKGSCTRKRGVLLKNTKFWGWMGLEGVNVWVLRGMGINSMQESVFMFKPHQNPANPIHRTPRLKDLGIFR